MDNLGKKQKYKEIEDYLASISFVCNDRAGTIGHQVVTKEVFYLLLQGISITRRAATYPNRKPSSQSIRKCTPRGRRL